MPELTTAQRLYIRKRTKVHEPDPSDAAGELNIVPFLDIVVNLIMFLLLTTMTVLALVQLEAKLPISGSGGGGARPQDELNLSVTVTVNGVIVAAALGKLAEGCEQTASGRVMTVPKVNGEHNWAALTECLVKVKNHPNLQQFRDETKAIIQADPTVIYDDIVHAMDAIRAKGSEELYPEVLLSVGVR